MKTYYFSETSPADASGDAILLPQSTFRNIDVVNASKVGLQFQKIDGTHDNSHITITHAPGKALDTMRALAAAMAGNTRSNVIDLVEAANAHPVSDVPEITTVVITE